MFLDFKNVKKRNHLVTQPLITQLPEVGTGKSRSPTANWDVKGLEAPLQGTSRWRGRVVEVGRHPIFVRWTSGVDKGPVGKASPVWHWTL